MTGRSDIRVAPGYQAVLRQVGLDGDAVFEDPRIHCWRDIRERQNCTLDETLGDGRAIRLHIKRFKRPGDDGAQAEVRGIQLLQESGIATVPLVAWGHSSAGRGFIITEDLAGFRDAEQAVRAGLPLDRLISPIAAMSARLHQAGLHHRDLYLCHFFVRVEAEQVELRLIDAARVSRLPRWFARRWIIKDLAQLIYSLQQVDATADQQQRLLADYAAARKLASVDRLQRSIARKVRRIAAHDQRLRQRDPTRNVSIPT